MRPELEIACDESGAEGENLIGGVTDVFAHAGVVLDLDVAESCVLEVRDRIRSPASEYKAVHLLRGKHRAVLEWLLSSGGPLYGNATVFLAEKTYYFIVKLMGDQARTVYDEGPGILGEERWNSFLRSYNELMRGTRLVPELDPLLPAIVRLVERWSEGGHAVSIVHDRQTALNEERIAWLKEIYADSGKLAGLRLVAARSDARVQIADFLAGVARKIASDELNGRGDDVLTGLLRPYVDPASIWGDLRSWGLLGR
ncbi:hypothetical protein [Nonomuraea soli]|uniref:DUF3800 domain-containing protein n=1 Tax=Nonomuraea soli TaxID=1032476 RepID=A0A7W0CJA9_9ACTN|nr:hypothetical protein [Nonomuraea soli]MBA2891980.1 hypothetical protein [Nonomuraea soli]